MTQNLGTRSHKHKTNLRGNAYSCSYCLHMPSINWYCLDNTLTIFLITPFKTSLLYNLSWKSNTWNVMPLAFTKYLYKMYNVHLYQHSQFFLLYRERQRITRHYSTELQTAKQTLTTSKHSTEFTYSDFPCHLKVNRDKLALINCLWKWQWRLPLIHSRKIDQLDRFRLLWQSGWENSAHSRNQSDCRICWIPSAHKPRKS